MVSKYVLMYFLRTWYSWQCVKKKSRVVIEERGRDNTLKWGRGSIDKINKKGGGGTCSLGGSFKYN